MIEDPNLTELWRTKAKIADRFATVKEYAQAVVQLAKERPLPPPGKQRKMIPGFPRGQSVADPDETMAELYEIKERLSLQLGRAGKPAGKPAIKKVKKGSKTPAFRSTKGPPGAKHRGNVH